MPAKPIVFHFRQMNENGAVTSHGGVTVIYDPETHKVSAALCSTKDNYWRLQGRKIATTRRLSQKKHKYSGIIASEDLPDILDGVRKTALNLVLDATKAKLEAKKKELVKDVITSQLVLRATIRLAYKTKGKELQILQGVVEV